MPAKIWQPSKYKEEVKEALRQGALPEEVMTKFPISRRSAYRYLAEVKKEQKAEQTGEIQEQKPPSAPKVATPDKPTPLAVVTTPAPGPIVFRMGSSTIDLNPEHLYDAYRYCQDIKTMEPSIDDDFSLMLKVAMKHVWELFSRRDANKIGVGLEVQKEEGNGRVKTGEATAGEKG